MADDLLAADCDTPGTVGYILHKSAKLCIRGAINSIHKIMSPVFKHKEGKYFNCEVGIYREIFQEVAELDRKKRAQDTGFQGDWHDYTDSNIEMYENAADIICAMLDEDSYYLIRYNYVMNQCHERHDELRAAMNNSVKFLHWEQIYRILKQQKKIEEQALPCEVVKP